MPRKRRTTKRRARYVTWSDIGICERLDFFHSWAPPPDGHSHWETWDEFLEDWSMVRENALEDWRAQRGEMLAYSKAEAARRKAELEAQHEECWIDLYTNLYDHALERVAEEEAAQGPPFAEIQYQRALQGLPVGREEEEVELSAEDGQ